MLHTRLHLYTTITRRTNGRSLGIFIVCLVEYPGTLD